MHLIPASDAPSEDPETLNANVFRNLDSPVSEGGENFSTGYASRIVTVPFCHNDENHYV